jgi:hypothetical protein
MARFTIAAMNVTASQRDGITNYLGTLGAYWHWMPDFWLLNSTIERPPSEIRDAIHAAYPNVIFLVLEVAIPTGEGWAGAFPTERSGEWGEWLEQQWKSLPLRGRF